MESVNIMIIANAGVIDNAVVVTHRRDELIRHLGVIFLVALDLVKSSAIGILDLIVEVFSAELGLATEISDKANLIAAGGLASVDTILLGSCSETCDLGRFAGGIHVEPFALYSKSKKIKSIKDIKKKARIGIPNDPSNEGRALLLLQEAGLITLDAKAGITATVQDIKSNPLNLKFVEVEAASLPRVLADVDAAVINGNYAIPAGLSAKKDGLFVEGSSSPYVNIIAVKAGNENKAAIKALVKALQSDKVRKYIDATYPNGEVVVVF